MSTFKSWRWSRLTEPSAIKRLWTHPQWFVPCIATIVLTMCVCDKSLNLPKIIEWLCWSTWVLLAVALLQNICCADEYYEIKSGKKLIRKIYLYTSGYFKKSKTVDMIIRGNNYEIHRPIEAHQYDFHKWDDFTSFLFTFEDNYYYSSPVNAAEYLGQCIGTTVFSPAEKENQLVILDDHGTTTMDADAFFLNGAYIPPLASKEIYDEDTEEKLEVPEEYLIAKRGRKYSIYGLYYISSPKCRKLKAPNVIFKEGVQDVVLQWNDEYGYREIYRTRHSVKRQISDVFVELTYQHGIGGTIRKFNEQTQKIDLLYKGCFHAIDFDNGSIIGDNGYEYIPET